MSKSIADLLLLGDARLYETAGPVLQEELPLVKEWVKDMHDIIIAVRQRYGFGRAIAAPQLGIGRRLIYMFIDKPVVIINPEITSASSEMFELWDDCMSFPNLLVRVKRHREISLRYLNEKWEPSIWNLKDDMAELIQHEYDHLDGILCTMRAIDEKSFKWRL